MRIASSARSAEPPPTLAQTLGHILITRGHLTEAQAKIVAAEQNRTGQRFGDIALKLGFLSTSDIDEALSTQFGYAIVPLENHSLDQRLVSAYAPRSAVAENFRSLRSQILLRTPKSQEAPSLAITSGARGDGRSYFTANLGVVFAQLGARVLLIDANLRHPSLHQFFKLNNRFGLSGLLAERNTAQAIQAVPALPGLSIVVAGPAPPNPQELLVKPIWAAFLRQNRARFDYILVDTPAADNADAHVIAAHCGQALILARRHASSMQDVRELGTQLQTCGVYVLGMVLNDYLAP